MATPRQFIKKKSQQERSPYKISPANQTYGSIAKLDTLEYSDQKLLQAVASDVTFSGCFGGSVQKQVLQEQRSGHFQPQDDYEKLLQKMMEDRLQKKRSELGQSRSISATRSRGRSPQDKILEVKSNILERMREEVLHEADENVRDTSPVPITYKLTQKGVKNRRKSPAGPVDNTAYDTFKPTEGDSAEKKKKVVVVMADKKSPKSQLTIAEKYPRVMATKIKTNFQNNFRPSKMAIQRQSRPLSSSSTVKQTIKGKIAMRKSPQNKSTMNLKSANSSMAKIKHNLNRETLLQSKPVEPIYIQSEIKENSSVQTPLASESNFQSLQKEIETAIRVADTHMNGSIDRTELRGCLMQLNYLTAMRRAVSDPTMYYRAQINSPESGALQMEQAFLDSLWMVLNPNQLISISNAILYDVFLLIIYNVSINQPLTQIAESLSEYLLRFYNNSLPAQVTEQFFQAIHMPEYQQRSALSEVNCFLTQFLNSAWTLEKTLFIFKQLHANKLVFNEQTASAAPEQASQMQSHTDYSQQEDDIKSNLSRYQMLYTKPHEAEIKIDQATQQVIDEEERKDHVKKPPVITNPSDSSHKRTQQFRLHVKEAYARSPNNLMDQSLSQRDKKLLNVPAVATRLYTARPRSSNAPMTTEQRREHDELQKHCTFRPQTNRRKVSPMPYGSKNPNQSFKNDQASLSSFSELVRTQHGNTSAPVTPKGYHEQIERMRAVQLRKKLQKDKMEKQMKGEQFDRVHLAKMKPPSFIDNSGGRKDGHPRYDKTTTSKKKRLLLYVDVNVTPSKTGRIGIYEGDDLRLLARNFCKAFQLNKSMLESLHRHLEQNLAKYLQETQAPIRQITPLKDSPIKEILRLPSESQLGYSMPQTPRDVFVPLLIEPNDLENDMLYDSGKPMDEEDFMQTQTITQELRAAIGEAEYGLEDSLER